MKPEEAAHVQATIEAAYRAAETGRSCSVPQLQAEAELSDR